MSYRKIGGLRFLRLGRLQLSWCVVKKPRRTAAQARQQAEYRRLCAKGPLSDAQAQALAAIA